MSSSLNQAHQHAADAEDFLAKGMLVSAAEEYYKAAEAFQTCIDAAHNDNTKRTLRMLHNENIKAGKELQRKIAKLEAEGKDPNTPAPSTSYRTARANSQASDLGRSEITSSSTLRQRESMSSTVDESFMLLAQQNENSDDPFDKFWKVTGELMINLSQPIGFPTAALAAFESLGAKSVLKERRQPPASGSHLKEGPSSSKEGKQEPAVNSDEVDDEDWDSSDSFFVIPSATEPSGSSHALKKENTALKAQLETMQQQIVAVQKQMTLRAQQDQQLRDHLMLARKEAHRAMASSTTLVPRGGQSFMDLGLLAQGIPSPPPGLVAGSRDTSKETQLARRVKELEEELRLAHTENEKQKQMINKFRERWEKLKESARRKRSAKLSGQAATSSVRERIEEEPEAEEAAVEEQKKQNREDL